MVPGIVRMYFFVCYRMHSGVTLMGLYDVSVLRTVYSVGTCYNNLR